MGWGTTKDLKVASAAAEGEKTETAGVVRFRSLSRGARDAN